MTWDVLESCILFSISAKNGVLQFMALLHSRARPAGWMSASDLHLWLSSQPHPVAGGWTVRRLYSVRGTAKPTVDDAVDSLFLAAGRLQAGGCLIRH